MDFESHKKLADNAVIKVKEMLDADDESTYRLLLHFAHVARLHYEYSTFDKANEDYLNNVQMSDQLLLDVYKHLGLHDSYQFLKNTK